ncbi:MAG: glycosyl hydrolase family 28-related protein [Gordonia sp. (in: high G+C Gram-positive bacteria)]
MHNDVRAHPTRRGTLAAGALALAGVAISTRPAHAADYISTAEKGIAGGVATLDSSGMVLDASEIGIDSRTVADHAYVVATATRFNDETASPATIIDPTGTTDSSKGIGAAIAATPEGGTLVVPNGTYRITSTITITKSITLQLYGTTWEIDGDFPFIQFNGTLGTTQPVSAVVDTQFSSQSSDGSTTTTVAATQATLVGPAPTDWTRGRFIKIVADDFVTGARSPTSDQTSDDGYIQARVGQIMEIQAISGVSATLEGKLRKVFSTNIRAAAFLDSTIRILGGTVTRSPATLANNTATHSLINIVNAISPEINGLIVRGTVGPVAIFINCLNPQFRNSVVSYCQNDPSPTNSNGYKLGYGVQVVNCQGGITYGNQFYDVRHGFTDDVQRIKANQPELYKYGWSCGHTFQANLVQGSTSAAVSPHSGGECHQFLDNLIQNVPAGFVLRGDQHLVQGNTIRGCSGNALESSGENGGSSGRHRFIGNHIDGCRTGFLFDGTLTDESDSPIRETSSILLIDNHISGVTARIGGMRRAHLDMRRNSYVLDSVFKNNDRAEGYKALITVQDSRIYSIDNLIDTTHSPLIGSTDPSKTVPVLDISSAISSDIVGDFRIRNSNSAQQFVSLVTRSGSSTGSLIRLNFKVSFGWIITFDAPIQYFPNPSVLKTSTVEGIGSYLEIDPTENNLSNSTIVLTPASQSETEPLGLRIATTRTAGNITVRIAPTANITLSTAGWGYLNPRDGQIVGLHNTSSTHSITIPGTAPFFFVSNAGNGMDFILLPGESMLLSLSGTRARQIGSGASFAAAMEQAASADPSSPPSSIGLFYIRLDTGRVWISKGVSVVSDWVALN